MNRRIIDTHLHIWDLGRAKYDWLAHDSSILNRTYTLGELQPCLASAKVTHGVLVQAANNPEDTELLLENAASNVWIAGVVGWLPLMDPAATERALHEKYLNNPYFKGVRHLIHNEPDPEWLLQQPVLESLGILARYQIPYDFVGINSAHLNTVIRVAGKVPGLRIVLDHLNQPPIAGKEKFGVWGSLIKEAGSVPNLYCKISGLGTASGNFAGWTTDDIKPYILYVLEIFGADRCFCGGDWPVALLAGDYEKAWLAYQQVIETELDDIGRNKIFSENADTFYKLGLNDN